MAKKADPTQMNMFVDDTRHYRYTLIIHPGFQITEKVKQLKELVNSVAPLAEKDLYSKPHITLCYIDKDYKADDFILDIVKSTLKGLKSFDIKVDGSDYWENGTLFLKLKDQGPVYKLMITLQEALKVNQGKAPHITIARNLKKKDFDNLVPEDFEYQSSFSCNSLTILKKILDHPEEKSEILEKIKFPG